MTYDETPVFFTAIERQRQGRDEQPFLHCLYHAYMFRMLDGFKING